MRGPGRRLLGRLVSLELGLAGVLFAVMVVINVAEVAGRYLLRHSFTWMHDVTILLAAWTIFLGFTAVVYHGRDIVVTFIVDRFPGRARALAGIAATLGSLTFLAVVTWTGVTLVGVQRGGTSHMAHIPVVLYTWPLIVSAATLLLVGLADLGGQVAGLVRGSGGGAG